MATPRATARARRRPTVAAVLCGGLTVAAAGACGQPNPRILESTEQAKRPTVEPDHLSEAAKIRGLIAEVRGSELTFVHDGIERPGRPAADRLQILLDRDVAGVRTAREFIDTIAAPVREAERQDRVILGPESSVLARQWFDERLAALEGVAYTPPRPPTEGPVPAIGGQRVGILEVLKIVEASELTFIAPPRPPKAKAPIAPKLQTTIPKRKPKTREYSGQQFSNMLRKKWEFLGADIEDVETFIEEIASDSFATLEPYRVVYPDGREEAFATWLRRRIAEVSQPPAQGGGP